MSGVMDLDLAEGPNIKVKQSLVTSHGTLQTSNLSVAGFDILSKPKKTNQSRVS